MLYCSLRTDNYHSQLELHPSQLFVGWYSLGRFEAPTLGYPLHIPSSLGVHARTEHHPDNDILSTLPTTTKMMKLVFLVGEKARWVSKATSDEECGDDEAAVGCFDPGGDRVVVPRRPHDGAGLNAVMVAGM